MSLFGEQGVPYSEAKGAFTLLGYQILNTGVSLGTFVSLQSVKIGAFDVVYWSEHATPSLAVLIKCD